MDESPQALIEKAELELLNEQWATALELFNRALVLLNPAFMPSEVAEAENGRGVAMLELGRYGEAVKVLEAAAMLKPELSGVYYNLGLAWEGLGQADTALHNYTKALEREPQDAEIYFRRGGIWFGLGEFEKTVEDATKAIELHSGQAEAAATGPYIARGLAYHQLQRYGDALLDYSKALEIDPREAADAFFYRGLVFIDRGDILPARADLQAFLTLTDDLDGVLAEQTREIIQELDKLS